MNLFDILLSSKLRGTSGGAAGVAVVGVVTDGECYAGTYTTTDSVVIE